MKNTRALMAFIIVLFIIMTGALVYGFGWGNGWEEVGVLMDYPWFVVSLFDVYVGFILFCVWIAWRERALVAAPWIISIMLLGNFASCIYAAYALATCQGDAARLWMGRRRDI